MADRVLFIGWNRPVPGREKQSMQLWQRGLDYIGKLQSDGRIESFDVVLLSVHGGDLNSFIMLNGSHEKLAEIREENAFVDLMHEANYCVQGLGIVPGYIGESLTDRMARY